MTEPAPRAYHRRHEGLADQHRADQVVVGQHLDVLDRRCRARCWALGLPPAAPMSPPAQLTSMSTVAELGSIVGLHLRHRRRVADIAGDGGDAHAVSSRSARPPRRGLRIRRISPAGSSPGRGSRRRRRARPAGSAITRPRPRPEPVTKAILPLEFRCVILFSCHMIPSAAHVGGAAPDHVQLVVIEQRVVPALPGRAVVGVVGQAVGLRRLQAGGERRAPSSAR